MANRTLARTYLAIVAVSSGLSLGCDLGPSPIPPPPPPAAMSVTGLSPSTGSIDVATDVTISGAGFVVGSRVLFRRHLDRHLLIDSTTLGVRWRRDVGPVEVAVVNPDGNPVKAPQPFVYIDGPLMVFTEPESGYSTSDFRDVQGQVVQFDLKGRLIWRSDGTRLTGFGRAIAPVHHSCPRHTVANAS